MLQTAPNSGAPPMAREDYTRGAGVAIRNGDGECLFVKRAGASDHAGTWAFPGGYAHIGENEEAAAIRELAEEIGFRLQQPLRVRFDSADSNFNYTTFVHDIDAIAAATPSLVRPALDDENSEYVWAKPENAPQPLHPGVASLIGSEDWKKTLEAQMPEVSKKVIGGSEEEQPIDGGMASDHYAFDRASVRTKDVEGRLHVSITPISKANVCPYIGREIPDWQALGLQEDKIYQLLRDPDELRKAAKTFNNLPLLSRHVPVSAAAHHPELIVGSTGTDADFSHPYLKNSLAVWAKDAIDMIESGSQKELSSAYRYSADMTPGNYLGADYDGIMRNIVGNHVALVETGRAGTDVVVGDSKEAVITHQKKEKLMSKEKLSQGAVFVNSALTALLMPKLAQDAKMPDLSQALAGVTLKNFAEMKPKIIEGVAAAFKDVPLAKDASLDEMHGFIDRLDKLQSEDEDPDEAKDEDPEAKDEDPEKKPAAFDAEGLKSFLKDKMSEDNFKALDAYLAGDDPPEFEGKPVKEGATDEEEQVNKSAMDEMLRVTAENATKAATKIQQDIRNAERFVRPWVGDLVACDSAEAVHRTAAKILGIEGVDKIHPDALPHIIKMQPLPGDKPKQVTTTVAMDAASIDDFTKRFPSASRIGLLG